jgi:hypothetical protein
VAPSAASSQYGCSSLHQRTSHSAAADAWEAHSGQQAAGIAGSTWQQQQMHVPSSWQQQQAGLPLALNLPGAAYADAPAGSAAWDTHSTSSSGSCCGNEQQQPLQAGLKGSSRGSPLPLPGRGDCVLPITRSLSGDGKGWGNLLPGRWDSSGSSRDGGLLAGSSTSCSSSSRAVVAASLLALAGAAGSGGALGLQLAGALAAAPDHIGHVVPPMVLLGELIWMAAPGVVQSHSLAGRLYLQASCGSLLARKLSGRSLCSSA